MSSGTWSRVGGERLKWTIAAPLLAKGAIVVLDVTFPTSDTMTLTTSQGETSRFSRLTK